MKFKQKHLFVVFIGSLLLFFNSCDSNQKKSATIIYPEFAQNERMKMTSIVESVKYIQLNSDKFLGQITKIKGTNDYVFIYSSDETIHVFDYEGNYIKNITQKGNGPGEIGLYVDFAVDPVDHSIFVLDKRSIKIFSFENKFISEIQIENKTGRVGVTYYKNKIFLLKNFSMGQLNNAWEVYDKDGTKISEKRNSLGSFESNLITGMNPYFYKNNKLYYWNSLNDTIFQVSENSDVPGYLFSTEKYRVTKEELSSFEKFMNSDVAHLQHIYSSGNYLLLYYKLMKEKKKLIGLYNTNTGKYQVAHVTSFDNNDFGFYNDWDGGIAFAPKSQITHNESGETLVSVLNPFQLKELVASDAFKTSTPKYPEKKKELEQLANSLTENDNPVLMIVKLK